MPQAEVDDRGSLVATVAELWRYPVKSMRGESVASLNVLADGIADDRRFAIESSGAPHGKPLLTGRERARMLLYSARVVDGQAWVRTPGGLEFALHDPALLRFMQQDFGDGHRLTVVQSERPLTDCRPIALLSHEAVAQLGTERGAAIDARRFRANLVLRFGDAPCIDGFPEDVLVGRRILAGTAELRITERDPRCRVVTLDPETAEADPSLMKLIDRRHEGRVGIYAVTMGPGTVHAGDAVRLVRDESLLAP